MGNREKRMGDLMESYGKELILDIHQCTAFPCSRRTLRLFFDQLCELIDMEACDLFFWDYEGYPEEYEAAPPHLKGISAVQFIKTSNITIHTLDDLKRVYLNIFSCKNFDSRVVEKKCLGFFGGKIIKSTTIKRN